jgi:lipopolysaccharide transport system permease protein
MTSLLYCGARSPSGPIPDYWDRVMDCKSIVDADKLLSSHPKELWAYRELFLLLVKRDFVAVYKQTVLGPL